MSDNNSESPSDKSVQAIKEKISSTQMLRLKKKFIVSTSLALSLLYLFWVGGEYVADIIILAGIEWLRASTVGGFVIALGVILTIIFADLATDRNLDDYINLLEKKLKAD